MEGTMVVDVTRAPSEPPEFRPARRPLHRLLADRWAVTGGAVVLFFIVLAIAAPLFAAIEGHDPYTYDTAALNDSGQPLGFGGGISGSHWFGVEPVAGRDLFAVVVPGARTSLLV